MISHARWDLNLPGSTPASKKTLRSYLLAKLGLAPSAAPSTCTECSTFRWLLEPMLAATGFGIVTAEFGRHVYGTYTCISA